MSDKIFINDKPYNHEYLQKSEINFSEIERNHLTFDEQPKPRIFYYGNMSLGYMDLLSDFDNKRMCYKPYNETTELLNILCPGCYIRDINIISTDHHIDYIRVPNCTDVYFDDTQNKLIFGVCIVENLCIALDIQDHVVVINATYHENEDSKYIEYVDFTIYLIKTENKKYPYITSARNIKDDCLISYLFIDDNHPPMLVDDNIKLREMEALIQLAKINIGTKFTHKDHEYLMLDKYYMNGHFLIKDLENSNKIDCHYKDLVN